MHIHEFGFPGGSAGKESACNAGNLGSIPGLGRSHGEGNAYPLQYSGLENFMDCTVHGVTKSWTRLSDFHFTHCDTHLGSPLSVTAFACRCACVCAFVCVFVFPHHTLDRSSFCLDMASAGLDPPHSLNHEPPSAQ